MCAKKSTPRLAAATLSEQDGVRYLHLDSIWVQGAMRIRKPQVLVLDYVQRMMAALLLRPAEDAVQGRAVQLGLGAAALSKFTHHVLRMPTTVVEINPSVIQACHAWFHLPHEDGGLDVVQGDAGSWVADPAHNGSVDLLQVDLYDHDAASPVLDSPAFYADCQRVLADGGVMSVNLFGRDASFERSLARLRAAFGAAQVGHLQPCKEGNTIALVCKGSHWPDRETLLARAQSLHARWALPAPRWVKLMKPPPAAAVVSPPHA
jgi:spermidine synthase